MTSQNPKLNKQVVSDDQDMSNKSMSPQEVDTSPSATTPDSPEFGWSNYAERINGRFAMIGFFSILIIEILSHTTFVHWAGFN